MTQFLHIGQGQGGSLTLPFKSMTPPLTTIGTHGCRTCVCVYIPISADRCFIAHIDAHVDYVDGDTGWMPTQAQGLALKEFTKKVLTDRVPELANGDYSAKPGRSGAIVICPFRELPSHGSSVPATGLYVVEAINEFFNLKYEGTDTVTKTAHGFVVDHHTGLVKFLEFSGATGDELIRYNQLASILDTRGLTPDQLREATVLKPKTYENKVEEYGFKEEECGLPREWTFRLVNGQWTVDLHWSRRE